MNNIITLTEKKHEARVDSRVLAEHLKNQHETVIKLVDSYKEEFESIGVVRFEIGKPKKGTKGGRPERYALLNEDQAYLLLSFSRNTAHIRKLKVELVKAFSKFRKDQQAAESYLPFYHELHDEVKVLADRAHLNGSEADEKVFHMNFNKVINKAFDLEAGQRPDLPGHLRAKVTAANVIAGDIIQQCIAAGLDHKATYQKVKQAVYSLAAPIKVERAA